MKKFIKIAIIVLVMVGIFLAWKFGLFRYLSLERIGDITDYIKRFGLFAPLVFMGFYTIATVLFLPGLPLTIVAGIAFGPVYGSIWVSIASTIGATLAFLIGRYTGREMMVKRFGDSDLFKKLDKGVSNQGWKMVAITRLVPLFPFNAQNYAYGLTDISLVTYVFVSWICMLPATIGYVFLAGAIVAGEGDVVKTITYVGIGVAFIIGISIIGKKLGTKQSKEEKK